MMPRTKLCKEKVICKFVFKFSQRQRSTQPIFNGPCSGNCSSSNHVLRQHLSSFPLTKSPQIHQPALSFSLSKYLSCSSIGPSFRLLSPLTLITVMPSSPTSLTKIHALLQVVFHTMLAVILIKWKRSCVFLPLWFHFFLMKKVLKIAYSWAPHNLHSNHEASDRCCVPPHFVPSPCPPHTGCALRLQSSVPLSSHPVSLQFSMMSSNLPGWHSPTSLLFVTVLDKLMDS